MCRCGAYTFPHRMLGGACDGGAFVSATFDREQYGACRDCPHHECDEDHGLRCKVLHGGEALHECPALQDHVRYEGIKLYGVNRPPQKGPIRFRR